MKLNLYKSMVLVLFSMFFLGGQAFAAPALYDDFSGPYIDATKWYDRESVREVADWKLVSKIGNASGNGMFRNRTPFQNPNSIHTIECQITVVDTELDSGNNPRSFARIDGFFYNINDSGGATGDIYAAVFIGDRGNGGLEAYWEVYESLNDNVTNMQEKGSGTLIVPGTLQYETAYTAKIAYNGNNEFEFTVAGVSSGALVFDPPRKRDPVTELKGLTTGINADGGAGTGYASALFDNVFVNNDPYDDFSTGALEPTNWRALEFAREISDDEKLRLNVQANDALTDASIYPTNQATAYLKANVLIESGSEVSPGARAIARLAGWYYNVSGPPYNGNQDDVWVYNRITVDEFDNLKAQCFVVRYNTPDPWGPATTLFDQEFATPMAFDTEYTLSIEFTGSKLIFKCNSEEYQYDIITPTYPPSQGPHRQLRSRVYADPGESGYIKATFDDVYVAAPGSISGQVVGPDGPIQGLWIGAWARQCANDWLGGAATDEDGNYTIENLPPGPVYVVACATCNHFNYVDEWFDDNNGTTDCNDAMPVLVVSDQVTPGVNFDLERGPKRLSSWEACVYNGNLSVGFDVYPGFNNELVSATVALASGTQYEFDLVNDRFDLWDSECRYLDNWTHDFGPAQPADYGDYTLTLAFSDGAQETETFTLQEVTVIPVDESSISVTVNADGSAHVSWDRQTTDTYNYQVRVRDADNREIYRSAWSQLNINHVHIPASDLRCLELGETYRWLVRVYDVSFQRAETRYTTAAYSPSALTNRTSSVYAWAWKGSLDLGFDVRPGSRDNLANVSVTGPGGFSYNFDLVNDWGDLSTEARLGIKGWERMFDLEPGSYGTYNFDVAFKDGYTEHYGKTLSEVAVAPVDSSTMRALIYADGAITFSWDLPEGVMGQKYNVRIRSEDGSKEYYSSPTQEDMTTVTASFWDLRAMEHGQTYQWFVRATDDYWGTMNTMEQSGSLTFLYDPFPTYNPGAAIFGPDSANITNTYIPMVLGARLTYAGTGALFGYGHYLEAVAVEPVDSVSCLKVLIRGDGNNPDPDQDPEFDYAWVAQDNVGNVWLFAYEEHKDGDVEEYVFGKSDAPLLMPATPKAGQVFFQRGDEYQQVQATGITVPQLTTGLGPFTDCLKIVEVYGQWVHNIQYVAPNIGNVKEAWDLQWDPKGWELVTLPTGFPSVTTGLATDITSDSATLNGTVHPKGLATTYYFEYGTTTSYGSTTVEADAGSGWDDVPVNAIMPISDPIGTYHYRLVAYNSAGTSYGADKSFTNDTDADLMPDDWERNYFGDLSHDGTADEDADELTDLQEYQHGTDPTEWDTDSDLMPDGWEVAYGLDPLVDDADGDLDGDGVKNIDEYYAGSHPNNWEPDTPVLVSPVDDAIDIPLTPTLETAAFSDTDGDSHAATDWQISTDEADFSENLVFDVSSDTNLTSLAVPEFILNVDTDYYWRARFRDDGDASSAWSLILSFTTIDADSSDDTDQDGVPDEQEITDPNVDLDEDGNPDMGQADMKCVNTVVGDGQIAVKAGANVASIDSIESIDPAAIADTVNKPDDMPLGLIAFKITVINPDDPATVVVYMSEPAATGAKWYKYDPVNGWQDYSAHAAFSADKRSVTLELLDGGYGDADGLKNGFIIDPSGAGTVTAPAPGPAPAGGGGGGGGCFIDTAASEFRR